MTVTRLKVAKARRRGSLLADKSKMDEARAMLDELMGQERNLMEDEKKNRKRHFSDPEVCKYDSHAATSPRKRERKQTISTAAASGARCRYHPLLRMP